MTDNERLGFIKKDAVQGFTRFCGLEVVSIEPGVCVTRVKLVDHHLQQDGFVHAGLIAMMADHTSGYSAFTLVPPDRRILTIEYKINFLKPAFGDYLECQGKVIKPGKHTLVCESEVFSVRDGKKELAAKAMLTMAAVPEDKVPKP